MPYVLVPDHISRDTVEAFSTLHKGALEGLFIGGAFVVLMRRRRFLVNSCGELARDPSLARGLVGSLEDELRLMVHARVDTETTI